ncbi:MAG: phosphate signaling complex protein PhoU [Bdellovibrionales bacterium]|nr:phosphate signaling complex protein PhoU [Bdellovibrionales bacterium]
MTHLAREIENLKRKLLTLGSIVEENLFKATKALVERNEVLATEVVQSDQEIDDLEVEVEEDCLKALALHQPVAIDLRYIVAVLKINNDLERIGDLAVNIGRRARKLTRLCPPESIGINLTEMANRVRIMLHDSLEAMISLDAEQARSVCAADDAIDQMNRSYHRLVIEQIKQHPEHAEEYILFLNTSRHLERIADHATNIAEDVIYLTEGEIVRHQLS